MVPGLEETMKRIRLTDVVSVGVILVLLGLVVFSLRQVNATTAPIYPARLVGCGAYLAEDEAAHIRLVDFVRDDGGLSLTYRCVGGF
jgi:hypothetical protein